MLILIVTAIWLLMIFCSRSQASMLLKTLRCRSDKALTWKCKLHRHIRHLRNQPYTSWWQGQGLVVFRLTPLSKRAAHSVSWIPLISSPSCTSCRRFLNYCLGPSAIESHCPKTFSSLLQTPLMFILRSFTQWVLTMLSQGPNFFPWCLECYVSF